MFVLGLLYFFRFHFVFLFVKSYDWWEVCELHKDWGGTFAERLSTPLHAMVIRDRNISDWDAQNRGWIVFEKCFRFVIILELYSRRSLLVPEQGSLI